MIVFGGEESCIEKYFKEKRRYQNGMLKNEYFDLWNRIRKLKIAFVCIDH